MSKKVTAAIALAIALLLWSSTTQAEFFWNGDRVALDCKDMSEQLEQAKKIYIIVGSLQPECLSTTPVYSPECLTTLGTLHRLKEIKVVLEQEYADQCAEAQSSEPLSEEVSPTSSSGT